MDEDLQKDQAVKNQRALWDKALEFRFLLQKAFSSSNSLPQEPVRTLFCDTDNEVREAYSDLLASSKKTLDSILELQQALLENNPSIMQPAEDSKQLEASGNSNGDNAEEWLQISQMQSRIASFRNKSIDKWQRKTQVTTGAAAIKDKLHAFNQSISQQVAAYMRDPSNMIKGMQQNRSVVAVFGNVPDPADSNNQEETGTNGDPELLDDPEFYQQLLKEFFNPSSFETAFYSLKRLQTKKRKIVGCRAPKSRKQRYHVHESIVNFMAPQRWTEMIGGEKKGRVYGIGGMASQRFLKSSTYTPSEREQQLETKLDAMKVELTQLQVEMQVQIDTFNDFMMRMQHQTPHGTASFPPPTADMIYPTTEALPPYAHSTTSSVRPPFNPPHFTHDVDNDIGDV